MPRGRRKRPLRKERLNTDKVAPKHYRYDDIVAAAEDLGEGWSRATIELNEGDIVESCLSSKWDFRAYGGPATIEYLIAPGGITVTIKDGSPGRHYREGAVA